MEKLFILWNVCNIFIVTTESKQLNESRESTNFNLLENILRQYDQHIPVFHFDDTFKFVLDDYLSIHSLNQKYVLYSGNDSMKRPPETKIVNIYLMDSSTFRDTGYYFRMNDVNIFVIKKFNEEYFKVWNGMNLKRAAVLFIVDFVNDKLYSYSYYYGIPQLLIEISIDDGIPDLYIYHNEFKQFNGYEFTIHYVDFAPYFWCNYHGNKCSPQGFENVILETMSVKMNFTYELVRCDDGSWQDVVEAVGREEVEWAIGGFVQSAERGFFVGSTRDLSIMQYGVLFAPRDESELWLDIKGMMISSDWRILILLTSVIMLISYISKISNHTLIPLQTYVMMAWKSLLEQSYFKESSMQCLKVKTIFLTWWIMGVTLTTLFRSKLSSSSIRSNIKDPETINELMIRGYSFLMYHDDYELLTGIFMTSDNPIYREVAGRILPRVETCDALQLTLERKLAYVAYEYPLQFTVAQNCPEKYPGQFSQLKLLKENLLPINYNSWMMKRSTPFQERLSIFLAQLHDAGLMSFWFSKQLKHTLPRSNERMIYVPHRSLPIGHINPVLAIYGMGISISSIVFLKEISCARIKPDI